MHYAAGEMLNSNRVSSLTRLAECLLLNLLRKDAHHGLNETNHMVELRS